MVRDTNRDPYDITYSLLKTRVPLCQITSTVWKKFLDVTLLSLCIINGLTIVQSPLWTLDVDQTLYLDSMKQRKLEFLWTLSPYKPSVS